MLESVIGKRIQEDDQSDWEQYRAALRSHLPFHDLALGLVFAETLFREGIDGYVGPGFIRLTGGYNDQDRQRICI